MRRKSNKLKFAHGALIYSLVLCTQSTALGAQSGVISTGHRTGTSLALVRDGVIYLRVSFPGLLNQRAKKDLTSGLSSQAIVLGQVLDQSGVVVVQNLGAISAKYDLWEETFYLTQYGEKYVSPQVEKVVEAFENPKLLRLGSLNSLKKGMLYKIRSIETINPLEQEKFQAVQDWMIQQKSAVRGLGGGVDSSVVPSIPETAFKALFYSLWKRAELGEPLTGELRGEVLSDAFTLESLHGNDGGQK